jgi:spore maturation protein SpmA
MLNYLWSGMILIGIFFAAFSGKMPDITTAALDSSKEAVTLCITMMGVMSFWTGLMGIAEKSGILKTATVRLSPLIHFLFPELPKDQQTSLQMYSDLAGRQLRQVLKQWKSFRSWKKTAALEKQQDR